MEKLGIDNLKIVVKLIAILANVGDKMGHEKGAARWAELLGLVTALGGITSLKWDQVVPEIKDLDDVERAALEQVFKDEFQLVDKSLEEAIEHGIVIAEKQVAVVQEAVALAKQLKGA